MFNKAVDDVINFLLELKEDLSVPKNVKLKVDKIIAILQGSEELSIRVNKASNELDEIADDSNMQPYTRTQTLNIVSMLEKL